MEEESVELRTMADVEGEISSRYFHQEDEDSAEEAIRSFYWPKAEETMSKPAGQGELQNLCNKYEVPAGYAPMRPGNTYGACLPPPAGYICVYADALEAGMRLPLHDFYVAVLLHYGLAPSQLAPNAWRYMAGFVILCKEVGVDPLLSVFRFFFSICNQSGWYHFRHYAVEHSGEPSASGLRRLFTGLQPMVNDWKTRFFLLGSPSTIWACPVKWAKPCRDSVRTPPKTKETTAAITKLLEGAGGSGGLDLKSFLKRHRHHLPVGTQPTLTPEQRAVKQEAAAAAAAITPRRVPTATGKRKSPADVPTSSQQGSEGVFVGGFSIKGTLENARHVAAHLFKFEKELRRSEAELAQLNAKLTELERVSKEKDAQLARVTKQNADQLAQLTKDHAAQVNKVNEEHAASIKRLGQDLQKDVDAVNVNFSALTKPQ